MIGFCPYEIASKLELNCKVLFGKKCLSKFQTENRSSNRSGNKYVLIESDLISIQILNFRKRPFVEM